MHVHELRTPALLVDLDAMESNLSRMAAFFRDKPTRLRPHFKNHKAPLLAAKQVEAGAIGVCCATVREAEILVQHGIRSILVANEISTGDKIHWLADLSRHADVIVAVDDERVVGEMARIARQRRAALSVVVDCNVGLNRCGVQPGEPALRLAKQVVDQGLRFRGLMGYEGHLQALPPGEERDRLVSIVGKSLVETRRLAEAQGIPVEIVSTAGTGTYAQAGVYPGVTEIQAGSYLLMDTIYVNRGSTFQRSLTILVSVISRPEAGRAVIDCGVKELSAERGLSTVKGIEGVELKALHAEHGLLEIRNPDAGPQVGQKIELWVHYSDATVNLHRQMYGVRDGLVEEVLSIEH
ncbi:MAG TPA: alanine racemase [Bryobacteraceae bacterium]|nr:alanine racemase [Bryobacteraceae bacterium]